jgi:membrane protein implicated in regulation of membrane protease activity
MPQSVLILIIIICVTAIIALLAFIIYRFLRPKLKEEKPSEEEILHDEMTRVLEDVKDEETAKQISEYKEDE